MTYHITLTVLGRSQIETVESDADLIEAIDNDGDMITAITADDGSDQKYHAAKLAKAYYDDLGFVFHTRPTERPADPVPLFLSQNLMDEDIYA